ncbi:hypothetical protein [Mesorhizobium sp. B2-7-1]|uniref:hypothetical protein n=1 Tax=Mesorhizobium sp. B2-7-1 TaxID=2589909 RepID=UPI00112ADFDE|nr:hypothetical protein [Mesorhizobium sp. B2-7-1]TPJ40091.1 hypothetical protein FJ471_34100 [Mesorhizobium sp. B2-7-1]
MIDPPASSLEITRWVIGLAGFYLVLRMLVALFLKKRPLWSISFIFDAVVFSTSVLLLVGCWYPQTLKALGDVSLYLALAGMVGIGTSLGSVFQRDPVEPRRPRPPSGETLNYVLSDNDVFTIAREAEQTPVEAFEDDEAPPP